MWASKSVSTPTQPEALLLCRGATPNDFRVLPAKIILVRHAESEGNINNLAYTFTPDPQVPLVSPLLEPTKPVGCSELVKQAPLL